jgi:hypothetical protein
MKIFKFLKSIFIMVALALTSLMFSCEDPVPECEANNTGTFVIYNNSMYTMTVDIDDGYGWIGERTVGAWGSVTYSNVSAGSITVWEYDYATGEAYWNSYVDACETTEFNISINKSTENKTITSNKEFSVNSNPTQMKVK